MAKTITALIPVVLQVDRTSSEPLQVQIFSVIRDAIADGRLRPGTRLPSTRDMARELGVSRNAVMNAFRFLTGHGLIESRQGAGTVVVGTPAFEGRKAAANRPRTPRRALQVQGIPTDVANGPAGAFKPGVAAVDLFPTNAWQNVLRKKWRRASSAELAADDGQGERVLREAIAGYLGVTRSVRCDPEQIIIFSGAQQAIDAAARVLLSAGDRVCMEDPGYLAARATFIAAGAEAVAVPVDEQGFDPSEAKKLCDKPRAIYVTPAHQYPTGVTMSAQRRDELLAWAATSGSWIIEDDFGGEFQYRSPQAGTLFEADALDLVVFVGTFSQSLAPSIHCGYVVAPRDLVRAFAVARKISGRGFSKIEQEAIAEFITSGLFAKHVRLLRRTYRDRKDQLIETLTAALPGAVRLGPCDAGTYVAGYLDPEISDWDVSRRAAAMGITIPALTAYSASGRGRRGIVLGFGSTNEQMIRDGVAVLKRVLMSARKVVAS